MSKESESRRIARIEAFEQNNKKKKQLFALIVVVLILIFVGGIIWGINDVLLTEGTYLIQTDSASPKAQSADEAIDYFADAVDSLTDYSSCKADISYSVDIPKDKIVSEGNSALTESIAFYVNKKASQTSVKDSICAMYDENTFHSQSYGDDFTDKLIPVTFKSDDLSSYSFEYGYFSENDNEWRDTDTVYLEMKFEPVPFSEASNSAIYESFAMNEVDAVTEEIKAEFSDTASIDNVDISCSEFNISLWSDRLTDKVKGINYTRRYNVSLSVTFIGEYASLGCADITFTYAVTKNYSFTYAGINVTSNELWLSNGDSQWLEAKVNANQDTAIKWSSSDEEIVSVDDRGYIKAKKISDKSVTVTAQIECDGRILSDSCEIYVRIPVKEIVLDRKGLGLSVGETVVLNASVKPDKATFKDVLWFSDNKDIASVDTNGLVSANAAGKTTIYAVSLDGKYKTSCIITVN